MLASRKSVNLLVVAALVAATTASLPLAAQSGRLSLAERVERLEGQVQGQGDSDSNLELLRRINELQSELQTLRNLVEQQAFEIENLKRSGRDQYLDLDGRLGRLEGAAPASAATAPSGGVTAPDAGMAEDTPPPAADATTEAPLLAEDVSGSDPAAERRAYDNAFDALKEGRFAEAARRFRDFLDRFPDGEFAPNAQYWLGESYYVTQNYTVALEAFQALLSRYPGSAKAPDALLKVGYCHYELRAFAEAEAVLNQVIEQYPDTSVSRLAQSRLRALRLENRP